MPRQPRPKPKRPTDQRSMRGGGNGRVFKRGAAGGRRKSSQYTWNKFLADDDGANQLPVPTYRPPPKPIKTIRLGDDEAAPGSSSSPQPSLHAPSSVDQQQQQPTTSSSNFCASWLAKNQHLTRTKKVEEVVLDESFRPACSQDDSIIVLDDDVFENSRKKSSEPRDLKKVFGRQEPGTTVGRIDSQDSIVFVGEYPRAGRTMTQLETNMAETFWSNGASSSSSSTGTTQQTCKKIDDGFSRDCKDFKRLVRCWNRTEAQSRSKIPKISSQFTICSYNVLCQKTIARTDYLYRHLKGSAQFLDWEHRWRGLQVELPTFDADILGLQEVQADHFVEHFQPLMKKYGYEGVYKQKFGTQQKDDGCALFYHPAKFELVANQEVNYFISDTAISNRENIAQIVALRCRITKELILVANTHLLFNEERGDVKLAQLAILFASIHKMREDFAPMVPPVFVMGDFNIEPNSKVYDFIVDGRLLVDGQPIRTLSGQSGRNGGKVCNAAQLLFQTTVGLNCTFQARNSRDLPRFDGYLRHPFNFSSAYHLGVPPLANHDQRFISTYHKDAASPDFIFFTPETTKMNIEKVQLLETFTLPTLDTLSSATPWPNKNVPSDHLPILAKFRLIQDSSVLQK